MSADLISNVIAQGHRLATHSWEYGAFAEALLEWYNPAYSVFGADPFPGGKVPVLQVGDVQALAYAKPHIWTNMSTLVDGDGEFGFLLFPLPSLYIYIYIHTYPLIDPC